MNGSGSSTLSKSGEEGYIVQGVRQLPEAVVEVTNLEGVYEGDWKRMKEEVKGMKRTSEIARVATARVHAYCGERSIGKDDWGIDV